MSAKNPALHDQVKLLEEPGLELTEWVQHRIDPLGGTGYQVSSRGK